MECPTCGKSGFRGEHGMKIHHKQAHGESLASVVEVECAWCGDNLTVHEHRFKKQNRFFCNQQHQSYWREDNPDGIDWPTTRPTSQFATGSRNSNWKGGPMVEMGPHWYAQRQKALERDGYQCTVCDMSQDEHNDVYGRDLNVHHVTPRRIAKAEGLFEKVNDLCNLVTLCHQHHEEAEAHGGLKPEYPDSVTGLDIKA